MCNRGEIQTHYADRKHKFKPITQIGVHNKLRQKLESRTAEMKFHLFLQAPEDAWMDQIRSVEDGASVQKSIPDLGCSELHGKHT